MVEAPGNLVNTFLSKIVIPICPNLYDFSDPIFSIIHMIYVGFYFCWQITVIQCMIVNKQLNNSVSVSNLMQKGTGDFWYIEDLSYVIRNFLLGMHVCTLSISTSRGPTTKSPQIHQTCLSNMNEHWTELCLNNIIITI